MSRTYRVTIFYREPTYEREQGAAPRVHRGAFDVDAPSRSAAIARARRYFDLVASQSSASWVREVVAYRCEVVMLS